MAGVTQTIPQYSAGMSEQPDNLKFPGQVVESVNAIPDVTRGLYKRPGLKRIDSSLVTDSDRSHSTAVGKLHDVQTDGSWFHYYRDETEGSYIGQIDSNGNVRVWSCRTGERMTTVYGTGGETALKAYLATGTPENIQTLTINDSTFVSNRDSGNANTAITTNFSGTYTQGGTTITVTKVDHQLTVGESVDLKFNGPAVDGQFRIATVPSTSTFTVEVATLPNNFGTVIATPITDLNPDTHFALIELLRAENGRQYGLNITNGTDNASRNVTFKRATRLRLKRHTLNEAKYGGQCLGIGTEVFNITNSLATTDTISTSNWNTSTERITVTGHGYVNDTVLLYHSNGGTKATQNAENLEDMRDYYVKDVATNDFQLTFHPGDNRFNLDGSGNNAQLLRPAENGLIINSSGNLQMDGTKKNLVFRITTLGQQGNSDNDATGFTCSYQPDITLLHGGEGWETGDQITVAMAGNGNGGGGTHNTGDDTRVALYTLEVTAHEETTVQAKYNGTEEGLIRPAVTPFDSDTTVTSDTILASIRTAIEAINSSNSGLAGQGISAKIIGTTIYLSSSTTFNVEVAEQDLMRVMQSSTNDVTELPNQCKNGYIVQIKNARMADEDDYYLRFDGANGNDGAGAWSECAKPGIAKRLFNLPVVIERTTASSFTVRQFDYHDRRVGDPNTNPLPSFIETNSSGDFIGRVNKILFFRNRLAVLSGENVILSRPGTLGKPDFFAESALATSSSDPIDISAASMFPSELFDGIEQSTGLIVFSSNQQFLLTSDDTVLNPDTAKLKSISTFNYNINIPPISLGTTVSYIDNSGRFSRLNEMANIVREGEPNIVEVSKVVPSLIPNDSDLLTNSRENGLILIGKTGTDTVFGYKYLNVAEKRQQAAWFKWKFNTKLLYHFVIDDEYFILDEDHYLQSMRLVESTDDLSITQDGIDYQLHLDNFVPLFGGTYTPATNTTEFSSQNWINQIGTGAALFGKLAVIDTVEGSNNSRITRYGRPTVDVSNTGNQKLTLEGDWSQAVQNDAATHLHVGYLYDYEVKFPTFYPYKVIGEGKVQSDVNSSLILHRIKLHFGKLGTYKTVLERVGKTNYEEDYESSILDDYSTNSAPYLEEYVKTVPIYERNSNITLTLKSSHPSPATLHSLSWEGDYSPRFYRRV